MRLPGPGSRNRGLKEWIPDRGRNDNGEKTSLPFIKIKIGIQQKPEFRHLEQIGRNLQKIAEFLKIPHLDSG